MPSPSSRSPRNATTTRPRAGLLALGCSASLLAGCPQLSDDGYGEQDDGKTEEHPTESAAAPVATVTGISGPGGLTSPDLAPGTFLGKGAVLTAGQTVQTPRGTLAELQLADGTTMRLNEDTTVSTPTVDWPRRFTLTKGEVVAVANANAPIEVLAGAEKLNVEAGEVQVRNTDDRRRYAVVSGRASLTTPSKTLQLGPGESVDAPLPEDTYDDGPELSLAPLSDTAWTRTFASAAQMTQTVPRGVGSLTARPAGTRRETQRLRMTEQKVNVSIAGRVAHTEIEQAFFNDRPVVLEGIYRFPLPSDGSISGLGLLVGNRWMEGEVLEKQRARNIFKQIVDATIPRDPALLEWEQGNLFKLRIFPIPGRGERKVRLSYTQILPVVAGKLRYRFPMGGSGAGGTPIDDFAFTVNIDRSELDTQQLAEIDTPMLALNQTLDADTVRLSTSVANFIPTADLGVDVPLASAAHRVHAATHLDKDGQAYFMLALRPEFDTGRAQGPTNIAFVVDRSHSTTPELWTMAQGVVQAMASTLGPDDRFSVLACDTACNRLPGGLVPTSSGAIADAGQFLADQDLAGASDVGAMMQAGADALTSAKSGQRVVVYLGDGTPTSGAMAPDELADSLRGPMQGARVMAVALGARSDLTALGAVLDATGGDMLRADPRDDVRELVRELSLRARIPVVSDLQLDLPDGMVAVRKQGDSGMRTDDTLIVAGKLSHPVSGDVVVRGRGPDGPVQASFPVELSADRGAGSTATSVHGHLPRTWAQMQIAHLTKTKGFEAHDEIVQLSQDYTVLSRFTAMLVLENDAMFREFNVVRREGDKDGWDGKLPPPEETLDEKVVTSKRPTTASDTTTKVAEAKNEVSGRLTPLGEGGLGKSGKKTPAPKPSGNVPFADPAPPVAQPSREPEPEPDLAEDLDDFQNQRNKDVVGGSGSAGPGSTPLGDNRGGLIDPRPAEPADGNFDFGDDDVSVDEEELRTATGRDVGAERPAAPAKTSKRKPQKKTRADHDRFDPIGSGGGGSGWESPKSKGRRQRWSRPVPRLQTRTVSGPSSRALARVDTQARAIASNPTQRSAHGRLVRSAIRAGHPQSTEFARAWAEVDPDHAPALLSLADVLAAAGDPTAARAYASAVEVRPFDKRQHENLAAGLTGKGDLARACSHRHAIVSIDPQSIDNHTAYVRCLSAAGRRDDARRAVTDARTRAKGDARTISARIATLDAELLAAPATPTVTLHRSAQLKASVSWTGEDDLDLVVVDSRGRRLSALRPDGKLRVAERRNFEEVSLKKVRKSVFVEVSRNGSADPEASASQRPVSGTLTVRTSGGRTKTIPFEMRGGTIRLAKVFWSR